MTQDNNPATELSDQPKLGPNTGNMGKGRPKGSRNKTTAILKDAILMAAKSADPSSDDPKEKSLEGYLAWAARETPGPFLGLVGKVLPLTLDGDPDNPVNLVHTVERRIVR